MNFLRSFLVSFFLFAFSQANTQGYETTSITAADGLIQEYVYSIFQDKRGFIWLGTFFGLYRYDGKQIKPYLPDHTGKWTLKSNLIVHITEDNQGLLWISTEDGVFIMDPLSEKFIALHQICPEYSPEYAQKVYCLTDGSAWLYQRKKEEVQLLRIHISPNFKKILRLGQQQMPVAQLETVPIPIGLKAPLKLFFKTKSNCILIEGANSGFFELNTALKVLKKTALFDHCQVDPSGNIYLWDQDSKTGYHTSFKHDKKEIISIDQFNTFITTDDGTQLTLPFYSTKATKIQASKNNKDLSQTLFTIDQPMSSANLVDRNGNIWVGTTGYGARKISFQKQSYRQLLKGKFIYNFVPLPNQQLWLGCFENTKVLNLPTGDTQLAPWMQANQPPKNIIALLASHKRDLVYLLESNNEAQTLEVLTFEYGSKKLKKTEVRLNNSSNTPPVLVEDHKDNLWIANSGGEIIQWNPTSNSINKWSVHHLFPSDKIEKLLPRNITKDKWNQIWIATNYGLIRINQSKDVPQFEAWHNYSNKGVIFNNDGIFCLYPDPIDPNLVWIGTLGNGFASFHTATSQINYFSDLSYPSLVTLGMAPDTNQNLWLCTSSGLSCFNLKIKDFLTLNVPESISKVNFSANAGAITTDGLLFFGSSDGLFEFNTYELIASRQNPKIYISDLKINGQPIDPDINVHPLNFVEEENPRLFLASEENSFSFTLSAPEASNRSTLQFRYRIAQLSSKWIGLGKENTISFAGLQPGRYLLELQMVTLGHSENSAPITPLEVIVSPPWHQTWYAYLGYGILGISFLWGLYSYDRKRISLRHESELHRQEMLRLSYLDQFKSRFYAYIAHEFKTPLTIIMGLTEHLKAGKIPHNPLDFAEPILTESNQMLRLIDEILDISKLEDGSMILAPENVNIVEYLHQIVDGYQHLMNSRNIKFEFTSNHKELWMALDPKRFRYILNNLISNAFHYSPNGGTIRLDIHQNKIGQLQLILSDSGIGIPQDKIPFIFEKYFRADSAGQNTVHHGLGLSFVRELIHLMEGSIQVSSELNVGTTFVIELPIRSIKPITYNPSSLTVSNSNISLSHILKPADHKAPSLLVVEDNPSVNAYLTVCLAPNFQLSFASDGQMGLEKATADIPDLILTDVMMPIMDGIQMINQLKQNSLTSHIPIVILSAKSELQDRLVGLFHGADGYLAKPFHSEELLLILQNLFQLQQAWRKRYEPLKSGKYSVNSDQSFPSEITAETIRATDEFIKDLYAVFESNYTSESFDVIQLCKQLHVSKTQLYRKLAAISDQTAMELLKEFRLQKALHLLQTKPELTIKEIAYLTGFKDRSHFSHLFSKKFDIAPSEMRKRD